jgi:hypothetical protein
MEKKESSLFAGASVLLVTLNIVGFGQEAKALNQLVQSQTHRVRMANVRLSRTMQSASDLLDRRTRAIEIRNKPIGSVLATIAYDNGIPIGLDSGDLEHLPDRDISLDAPETSLRILLDKVIEKEPRYTWKLIGGVIHVWPATTRDPLIAALLDTKISRFAFAEDTSKNKIQIDLMELPEIKTQMTIAHVEPLVFVNSPLSPTHTLKGVSLDESNLRLREILDKIILGPEVKQWIMTRMKVDGKEFISLQF